MCKKINFVAFHFSVIVLFLFSYIVLSNSVAKAQPELPSNEKIRKEISLTIQVLKPTLPKKVDAQTTWTDVKHFGVRGIQYYYQINISIKKIIEIPDINNILSKMMIEKYCKEPALYWYRDNFVEIKWTYFDITNEKILSIRANPNDCQ